MPNLTTGDIIGRYQLNALVGAGGMGQVFTALDPQLGRTVAVKLIRPDAPGGERGRARLLREAQALARLSHPNVVTVHDVGMEHDQVFLAMELVAGPTLDAWLAAAPRSFSAIRDVFVAAGRGLCAAHAAGIVHRDFKPANVIVGADRVVVVDFGLARATDDESETEPAADVSAETSLDSNLTLTGELVGTPRYMAPEQRSLAPVTDRSDQFSFAVALWEALYGVTPARRAPAPPPRKVPDRVRAALQRALATRPDERWPALGDLLAALGEPASARLRTAALMALSLAAIIGPLAYLAGRTTPAPSCGAPPTGLWDEATRADVRTAFLATDKPFARDSYQLVDQALRARLAAWSSAHEEACAATELRHEQSASMMDARMSCLARARDEIAAFVALLRSADARGVETATSTATRVGDLAACEHPAEAAPRDPRRIVAAAELERELARVNALALIGHFQEAIAAAPALVERARALGEPALLARALNEAGIDTCRIGRPPDGQRLLYEAAHAAAVAGDDLFGVVILNNLVFCVGSKDKNLRAARALAEMAEVALVRVGTPLDLRARLYREEYRIRHLGGDYVVAFAIAELEYLSNLRLHGDEHPETALSLADVADIMNGLGAYRGALATYARALPILERTRGPSHPSIAAHLGNMGTAAAQAGDLAAAAAALERAIAIQERSYGPEQTSVLNSLRNLANVRERQGQLATAKALLQRARTADEKIHGPDHLATTVSAYLGSIVANDEGDLDEAEALARKALAVRLAAYGPDHPDVADLEIQLADIARRRHDYPTARRIMEQALAVHRNAFGARHPIVAAEEADYAHILLDAGDPAAALPILERALAINEQARFEDADEVVVGDAWLSRALLATGQEARALEVAERTFTLAARRPRQPRIAGLAHFVLAEALGRSPRGLELARQARGYLQQAHENDEVARIDGFLAPPRHAR